jgi:hypothetical protein
MFLKGKQVLFHIAQMRRVSYSNGTALSILLPSTYIFSCLIAWYRQERMRFWETVAELPGLSSPVHDGVMPGCVDGLPRGPPATYPRPDAHGSAGASAPASTAGQK